MGEGSDRALTGTHLPAGSKAERTPSMRFQQDLQYTAPCIQHQRHAGTHFANQLKR